MKSEVRKGVRFFVKDLQVGNEVMGAMQSGVLVIGDKSMPFILRRKVSGSLKNVLRDASVDLSITQFDARIKTPFSRSGYVCVQFAHRYGTILTYVKQEYLRDIFTK